LAVKGGLGCDKMTFNTTLLPNITVRGLLVTNFSIEPTMPVPAMKPEATATGDYCKKT